MNIRAHHLLCLSRADCPNGWYNKTLSSHVKRIRKQLIKNSNSEITIVKRCDDICKKCPNKKGQICKKREKINYWILIMDNKILKKLKINPNSKHKTKDIFIKTIKTITDKDLKQICRGCEFLDYCIKLGINKSFIKSLK